MSNGVFYNTDWSTKWVEPFWKPTRSTVASYMPVRLGLCMAGPGTELKKNRRRTRDLG